MVRARAAQEALERGEIGAAEAHAARLRHHARALHEAAVALLALIETDRVPTDAPRGPEEPDPTPDAAGTRPMRGPAR
jgi:hypothetical protein